MCVCDWNLIFLFNAFFFFLSCLAQFSIFRKEFVVCLYIYLAGLAGYMAFCSCSLFLVSGLVYGWVGLEEVGGKWKLE